jgi:hypothetical protein
LNNHSFSRLSAELREGDPLCPYVTVERGSIELTLAQHAENTAQLAIACELLQRTRTELQRAWHDGGKQLQPYQEAALQSINECLIVSRSAIRRYRHSVRYEYAASLRELLTRTANALNEDARHEREQGHKRIAETIENMGECLPMVADCLNALLSQFLTRECMASEAKGRSRAGGS